ncbi:DUF4386 domain-containing protein [Chloroflexota bacterium]
MTNEEKFTIDPSWKGVYKVSGLALFASGAILVVFLLSMVIMQITLPDDPQVFFENPVPPTILYLLAAFGEFLLMPGVLGLYLALKDDNKNKMLIAAAFGFISIPMFLVSRAQIFSLFPISASYMATTSEILKAAYLASAERALELANIYATMGLMFLGVASILIGLVMLKGVFGKRVGYLVTVAGTCILIGTFGIFFPPIAMLVPIGLILNAVWQTIVGIKLYKLGHR